MDEDLDRLRTKNLNVKAKNFEYIIRNVALYSAWWLIFFYKKWNVKITRSNVY